MPVCGIGLSTVFRIIGQYPAASGSEPDSAKGRIFSFTNRIGHMKNDLRIFKDIPKIVTVDSIQKILQFLQDTRLAYVGGSVMPNQFERYQIRGIPIESDTESVYFGYFTGINEKLSPLGKEFADFLEGRLKND